MISTVALWSSCRKGHAPARRATGRCYARRTDDGFQSTPQDAGRGRVVSFLAGMRDALEFEWHLVRVELPFDVVEAANLPDGQDDAGGKFGDILDSRDQLWAN
jgi:hypothetical protein